MSIRDEHMETFKESVAENWKKFDGDSRQGSRASLAWELYTTAIDGIRLSIEEICQIMSYVTGDTYNDPSWVQMLILLNLTTKITKN